VPASIKVSSSNGDVDTLAVKEFIAYITFDAGNLPVAGGTPSADNQLRTVVLTSKNYGHQGSNNLTAQFLDPAASNSPLAVSLLGNAIRVNLATDATGAITSTAAEVAAAINAHPQVSNLVSATPFRTSTGAGVVQATP
jgi:hypothetical protein